MNEQKKPRNKEGTKDRKNDIATDRKK